MLRLGFTFLLILLNGVWISILFYVKSHSQVFPINPELKIQQETVHIQSIDFNFYESQTHIQLNKDNHIWKLTYPVEWEANPLAVEQFLRELAVQKPILSFDLKSKKDLDNYGLTTPFCTIKCNTKDHTYLLQVSTSHASNQKIYVLENETNKIFVLKPQFIESFCRSLEEWCNPFFCGLESIQTLAFDTLQSNLYLQKQNDEWYIKTPVEAKANVSHVETVCTQLKTLELKHFLSPKELESWIPQFTSDNQTYRLKISDKSKSNLFKILPDPKDITGKTYIAQKNDEGPLFTFKSNVIDRLLNAQETLRERSLFDFNVNAIKKIVYSRESLGITLQSISEHKWEVIETQNDTFIQAHKASSKTVKYFMELIKNLYVEEFLTASELPTLDDYVHFKLGISLNNKTYFCNFYYRNYTYFCQFEGESSWFKLTMISPELVELTVEKFQEKTLWKWGADEVLVAIEWIKANGKRVSLIPYLSTKKLHILQCLQAKKWLKVPLDLSFIPQKPHCIIFTTQDSLQKKRFYKLEFWERLNGNFQSACYDSQTFILTQAWIDLLFQLTYKPFWDKMSLIWNPKNL